MTDRKSLIRDYKQNPRPAGLFVVRNNAANRWLIGPSNDLPGSLNRHRFQLEMGSHPDKELQHDWTELGPDAFVIEVLDRLEVPEGERAAAEDLDALHQLWLEKLDASGQPLYPMSRRGLSNRTPHTRG